MSKTKQLTQSLKYLIENGTWKAHEKLPSLRQQAALSGFSLMTVMNVYQELEALGLIYAKQKSGYFVADPVQAITPSGLVPPQHIEINSRVFQYLKSIQSETMVPLGSAFPDHHLLYSAKLSQLLIQLARQPNHYAQTPSLPPGHEGLRKSIAQRYCLQGIPTDASDIVITSGGLDALNLALQAVTQRGDYIVLQHTSFYGAWQAAERLGLKVITIPEHAQDGLDLNALEQVFQHYPIKVCLLMLNSQHPVGFTVSDEIKQKFAELLQRYQIYLIEDDVYEELYYGHKKPLSIKYFDQHNLVLHCSSFSKTLGASFRIGWVYAGQFSEKIQHLQLMSTLSVNALMQNALAEYIPHRHYDKHLKNLRLNLQRLKKQYVQYLSQNLPETCHIHHFASGYFLWIKLPEAVDSGLLYQQLLQQNIGIAPSFLFHALQHDKNYIRINCSFAINASIEQALAQLCQAITITDKG